MTEAEWFTSRDARPMLDWVAERLTERKLRLFACASLRSVPGLPWEVDESIKYVEKYCDGLLRWSEVETRVRIKASQANRIVIGTDVYAFNFAGPLLGPLRGIQVVDGAPVESLAQIAARAARDVIDYCVTGLNQYRLAVPAPALVPGLRDIVGNPFRPIAFSPAWRTDTAVLLARQMHAAREFSAMPILADALQDAGCDSDDVLNHCRGDGPHVRGCWVVDLVLGKE